MRYQLVLAQTRRIIKNLQSMGCEVNFHNGLENDQVSGASTRGNDFTTVA